MPAPALAQNTQGLPGATAPQLRVNQAGFLAVNVALGAANVVAKRFLNGRPITVGALLGGAASGAVLYGGFRLLGTEDPALRLPGLETVAVGASLARNAAVGPVWRGGLTLPFLPLWIDLFPDSARTLRIRLSAAASVGLAHRLLRDDWHGRVDYAAWARSGVPIFRSPLDEMYKSRRNQALCGPAGAAAGCPDAVLGNTLYGVVIVAEGPGSRAQISASHLETHELLHGAQFVRDAILFAMPVTDAITTAIGPRVGPLWWLSDRVALDAGTPLWFLSQMVGQSAGRGSTDSYYEAEAEGMLGTGPCGRAWRGCGLPTAPLPAGGTHRGARRGAFPVLP